MLTKESYDPCMGSEGSLGLELISVKAFFFQGIALARRVSELHALLVHPACLWLGGEGSTISLLPNLALQPKVLPCSLVERPLVLDPFHPPPHRSQEAARLHLVYLVQALMSYIARTCSIRQTDQLWGASARPGCV